MQFVKFSLIFVTFFTPIIAVVATYQRTWICNVSIFAQIATNATRTRRNRHFLTERKKVNIGRLSSGQWATLNFLFFFSLLYFICVYVCECFSVHQRPFNWIRSEHVFALLRLLVRLSLICCSCCCSSLKPIKLITFAYMHNVQWNRN